jgi:tetratricopeptide (TPR) repeat protein
VIPTGEQLSDIARHTEGSLVEVPFGILLYAQAVSERTAVLEVTRRQVTKKIVLEGGVPVDCRSNLVNETLGRYMMAVGKLKELDFTTCLGRATARGTPLGEQLVEQGLVSPVELFKLLQQNLAKKLLDLFTWSEGEFRILTDDLQSESSLKVKVPQLIVTGITRFAPQAEVDAAVGPLVGKRLALHPAPPVSVAELRLTHRQTLVTDALAPRPRLDELAAVTGLTPDEITRLLYALAVIGVVVPVDQLPAQPPVQPVRQATQASHAAPPAHAGHAVHPGPDANAAQSIEIARQGNEVMQAYLAYRKQDPFDLLGIADDAPQPVIEECFLAFAARFAPWKFTGPFAPWREKACDLFLAGTRAYGQLADREQRETVLFRRRTLRQERAQKPSTFGIKTDLLDPEVQYRKGRAAMDAGKFREAILLLEFASDCDPQNGLYRAELAWSRFQAAPATAAPQALTDLDEALRIDPKCGLAVFYLGEIQGETGNYEAAEWHLQRAIKMMAPDRRPIDALKTLQARKKR